MLRSCYREAETYPISHPAFYRQKVAQKLSPPNLCFFGKELRDPDVMAASGTRSAVEKLSQQPVILLTSSSGGDSEDSDSDLSGDWEINPLPTKRQRMEVISGGSSPNSKLLSDGFLGPLPPPKPSKVSPMLSCKKNEHTKWNDTKICFLLKLLEDYNEPKWRHRVKWANGVWERIFQDFKKRFRNANVSKSQLQDRAYKMKQTYKLLKKLSETSRLQWDHTSNMLQGPKNAWRTLMWTNKDAKQWYNKPWPYYSICQRLFEGKKDEHTKWNDTKKCFLLKLLEDYNEPKWRHRVKWANGVWERIFQDFKKQFRNANVSKSQLQDRAYKMRQTYKLLKKLSETSRLRWDHTSNMLQGPKNAWRTLMKTNKDAKQWFNKPWPYYSICQRLFEASTGKPSSNLKLTREFTDMRSEREFSIKICMEAFYKLDGFAREDVLKVGRIFKIMENREMFMSVRDDDRELWLRGEMDAFQL